VEEIVVTDGGRMRRIDVPVDVPYGVNRNFLVSGVLGNLGGGPTGLFTVYDGRTLQQRNYNFQVAAAAQANNNALAPGTSGNIGAGVVAQPKASGFSVKTSSGSVSSASAKPSQATEQETYERLRRKLNATLFGIVYYIKVKKEPRVINYGSFLREGRAEVQVWVTDKSELARAKLRELGFETVLDQDGTNLIIGRISMEKLEQLAELEFVRYVSPQTSR
jgi:hypothetical protein